MTDPNPIDRLREALGKMGTEIETPEWYEDAQEALAQLETEREAYRRAFGPLVVGAEPLRCMSCESRAARIRELEGRRRESRQLLAKLVRRVRANQATPEFLAQVGDYLNRTHEQSDILRAEEATTSQLAALRAPALPSVGGEWVEGTIRDLERAAQVCLGEEQALASPRNHYVGVFCNTVRLCRESERLAKTGGLRIGAALRAPETAPVDAELAETLEPTEVLRLSFGAYLEAMPGGAVSRALTELERRARIERRLYDWMHAENALRNHTTSTVSVVLRDYRAEREWFAVRGAKDIPNDADRWTLTDLALDEAGFPLASLPALPPTEESDDDE